MRVLLSAFACDPARSSEHAVGWAWAELLSRDHEVTVLTESANVEGLRLALQDRGSRARVVGIPVRRGRSKVARWAGLRRWQAEALRIARREHELTPFDRVHHVTLASHRLPSHLWKLDATFVWGPVGGGEGVPLRFTTPRWLGWREALAEAARTASNRLVLLDRPVRRTARNANAWLATTEQTARVFGRDAARATIAAAATLDAQVLQEAAGVRPEPGPTDGLAVLHVGRLVGWKGLGYALRAFAEYHRDHPAATFDVYGSGRARRWFERLADELGVGAATTFHGRVPRGEVLVAYGRHQALLFPSLHDSSGLVVLEAQAAGLPVVCLDVGGPARLVAEGAGRRVPLTTPNGVVADLAAALRDLTDETAWRRASQVARAHATAPGTAPTIERLAALVDRAVEAGSEEP